jgi:hypothetical protein
MRALTALPLLLLLPACAPESAETPAQELPASESATADSRVFIVSPAQGDTVAGPDVTVTLDVSGVRIVQAGDTTAGSGHHHLYLDADLTPADQPVPSVPGSIVHMGDASTSYTFTEVATGEHRIIAVVGDGVHVPLQPWVVDTVRFVVR